MHWLQIWCLFWSEEKFFNAKYRIWGIISIILWFLDVNLRFSLTEENLLRKSIYRFVPSFKLIQMAYFIWLYILSKQKLDIGYVPKSNSFIRGVDNFLFFIAIFLINIQIFLHFWVQKCLLCYKMTPRKEKKYYEQSYVRHNIDERWEFQEKIK